MNENKQNSKAEIKELRRQIMSLQAQLEVALSQQKSLTGGRLLNSEGIDYYPGEQQDFLISLLKQAKEKCPPESRSYDIIKSLLSLNQPVGRGEEILNELERIFKKGIPNGEKDISALKAIGFTYISSRKHPKLKFHDKYMFVIPSTPGDRYCAGKNALAEISKCIAIRQKI